MKRHGETMQIAPNSATVEYINMDEEIDEFLQNEREAFEEGRVRRSPSPKEGKSRKGKEKIGNLEMNQMDLKERWRKKGGKEIKVACHNINGLKTKGWKLENLLSWAEEEEIAILGITESNLTEREGKFLTNNTKRRFIGYWASATEDKKKGSGVGILVEEQWEKHVGAVKRISEYMIEVILYFKQLELVVIGVYIPPNNKILGKSIQQKIVETVSRRNR